MRNLANFALFQAGWFACVIGAASRWPWMGPGVVLAVLWIHFRYVSRPDHRAREGRLVLFSGLLGAGGDSLLRALGLIEYPGSEALGAWPVVPAWIAALWLLFGTLPFHSIGWLRGRVGLAAVLGALGGPLSFHAGTRWGVIATGPDPGITYGVLAAEYALATVLLIRGVPSEIETGAGGLRSKRAS